MSERLKNNAAFALRILFDERADVTVQSSFENSASCDTASPAESASAGCPAQGSDKQMIMPWQQPSFIFSVARACHNCGPSSAA